ncbi:hypothetical protein BMS3Abin15_00903 [bacterium BMS3Abin15]|nr:hypothetical protein BMS3Abin15_00903 [bacterium BMS3Abin15]HDZ85450.1 hypothetical protein [Candidatus Moranbacteria bacterium]
MFYEVAQAGVISDAPSLAEVLLRFFNFLLTVVGIIAIIMSLLSGIMYLTAGGNESMMEKAKKSFTYFIIGTVVIFAVLIIVRTVANFIS